MHQAFHLSQRAVEVGTAKHALDLRVLKSNMCPIQRIEALVCAEAHVHVYVCVCACECVYERALGDMDHDQYMPCGWGLRHI